MGRDKAPSPLPSPGTWAERPGATVSRALCTQMLELCLPAWEQQACPCPGTLSSMLPSCPKEDGLLGTHTRLSFIFRASHCLLLKAPSDHGYLLRGAWTGV